jgi:transcriptional regulator with XRE-family HTH domain
MVSAVELGKIAPGLKTLAFFAKNLGVPLRSLIPDD